MDPELKARQGRLVFTTGLYLPQLYGLDDMPPHRRSTQEQPRNHWGTLVGKGEKGNLNQKRREHGSTLDGSYEESPQCRLIYALNPNP